MPIDLLLLPLTLLLGAALARVSLCAVAGVQQAIDARQYAGLWRLLLAACGAGLVLLPLAGFAPQWVRLPEEWGLHPGLIAGGVLLGLGALVNGACYLGSVLYLGAGNLNFLFTLAGIALGQRLAAGSVAALCAPAAQCMAAAPTRVAGALVCVAVIGAMLYRRRSRERTLAVVAGLLAGFIYVRHLAWSYGSVLEALAAGRVSAMEWLAQLSALLLFVGALAGAWFGGKFRWRWPAPWPALRCLTGGTIMGLGAARVPGGNDMLLLWAIPGLTLYGLIAYAVMLATIAAGVALKRAWTHRPAPAQ